jgi:glycosyltransferase involved in cell wall biosynthesis
MHILVHDFSGHPFQMQLSRELARRGHRVLHVDCASYATGKGDLSAHDDDLNLTVHSIDLGVPFEKYSVHKRFGQELRYGREFVRVAEAFGPDVILSSNDPLFAKAYAGHWCHRTGTPWVFWLQDIYSVAMGNAAARVPVAGNAIAAGFRALERHLLRNASAVVPISPDFLPLLAEWRVDPETTYVVENWAPLEELPERERRNAWSHEYGLDDVLVFLYAGTLGMKHNPDLLVDLARHYRDRDDVRIVVASEGVGADFVRTHAVDERLDNIVVVPFQPFDRFPDVLATGDVLVVILEPDAGVFSVPSKVLSYHCAARPMLASIPADNLAARIVGERSSGLVVQPGDRAAWTAAADALAGDAGLRTRLGANARHYAETTFDVDKITDRFEDILGAAAGQPADQPAGRARRRRFWR